MYDQFTIIVDRDFSSFFVNIFYFAFRFVVEVICV